MSQNSIFLDSPTDCVQQHDDGRRRIIFNVSGMKFETWSDTIERFPSTLLGNREKLNGHFCFETNQYFFDRNRLAFEAVLYFFQSNGKLIRPVELSMESFETECRFYELPDNYIEKLRVEEGYLIKDSDLAPLPYPMNTRQKIWYMTERPDSSTAAYVYNLSSLLLILLWFMITCAQTVTRKAKSNTKHKWFYTDIAFSCIFTLEYLVRLIFTPNRKHFLFKSMNIIDFASSVLYLLILLTVQEPVVLNFLKLTRLLRIVRFLKLGNSSKQVKLLGKIMASSIDDIGLLFLCLMMVVLIGASLLYFTEMGTQGTQFTSVPASSWWAIQTVVVLGYGDIIPKSDVGKLFASFFMIFGALTISLPVLSVVTKLVKIYGKEMS